MHRALPERLPGLRMLDPDARKVPGTMAGRQDFIAEWMAEVVEWEAEGFDAVVPTQSPLGEILGSPAARRVEGIAGASLDCHDRVRLERWHERGVHPDWPINMDHFCWAAFHRMHAHDPTFEARVLIDSGAPGQRWEQWTGWAKDDPRWDVLYHDSSGVELDETLSILGEWIERVRAEGPPLRREDAWWE